MNNAVIFDNLNIKSNENIASIPRFSKQRHITSCQHSERNSTYIIRYKKIIINKERYEQPIIIRQSDKGITKIVGIESRGFVMSSAVATSLGAGVVLCRKPGKLPCETVQESYAKEYGIDTIEIHKDAISESDVVLLHDDLLATGGTMKAACDLVKKFNPKKIYCNFIIELASEFPESRSRFDQDIEITSLLKF